MTTQNEKERVLVALRAWQKRAKNRRCSFASLCRGLKKSRSTLSSMLKSGIRRAQKKNEARHSIKSGVRKFDKKNPFLRKQKVLEVTPPDCPFTTAHCARISRKKRLEFAAKRSLYWRDWHRRNPNRGITAEQDQGLQYSQNWW